jgi:hypothetical protein
MICEFVNDSMFRIMSIGLKAFSGKNGGCYNGISWSIYSVHSISVPTEVVAMLNKRTDRQ